MKEADGMIPNFVTSTHIVRSLAWPLTVDVYAPWERDMMGEVIHEAVHLQPQWTEHRLNGPFPLARVYFSQTLWSLTSLSLTSASLSRCLAHSCRSYASLSSIDSVVSHFTEAVFSYSSVSVSALLVWPCVWVTVSFLCSTIDHELSMVRLLHRLPLANVLSVSALLAWPCVWLNVLPISPLCLPLF